MEGAIWDAMFTCEGHFCTQNDNWLLGCWPMPAKTELSYARPILSHFLVPTFWVLRAFLIARGHVRGTFSEHQTFFMYCFFVMNVDRCRILCVVFWRQVCKKRCDKRCFIAVSTMRRFAETVTKNFVSRFRNFKS